MKSREEANAGEEKARSERREGGREKEERKKWGRVREEELVGAGRLELIVWCRLPL